MLLRSQVFSFADKNVFFPSPIMTLQYHSKKKISYTCLEESAGMISISPG